MKGKRRVGKYLGLAAVFLLLIGVMMQTMAAEEFYVRLEAEEAEVRSGDSIVLTLTAELPEGEKIILEYSPLVVYRGFDSEEPMTVNTGDNYLELEPAAGIPVQCVFYFDAADIGQEVFKASGYGMQTEAEVSIFIGIVTAAIYTIDLAAVSNGIYAGYTVSNDAVVFNSGAAAHTYIITGQTNARRVVFEPGVSTAVTLQDVEIINAEQSPFALEQGSDVTVTLNGSNALSCTNASMEIYSNAGLAVPQGASVRIDGSGAVNVTGGFKSAGIGGGSGESAGNITIKGGQITASGGLSTFAAASGFIGEGGAGIGGGAGGTGGNIRIEGGNIEAYGGEISMTGASSGWVRGRSGAGIGGGSTGNGGIINIGGNAVVYAAGGSVSVSDSQATVSHADSGAGIGGGAAGTSGEITISGGMITAVSGKPYAKAVSETNTRSGAGIGGGLEDDGGEILLGGTAKVTAKGGSSRGAGVGGGGAVTSDIGKSGDSGTITINGQAEIEAYGGDYGAGIGGGGATIAIAGNCEAVWIGENARVYAECQGKGAAIGGGGSESGTAGSMVGIVITDQTNVEAINQGSGVGIGGGGSNGISGSGGQVELSGQAQVTASGGGQGAGIGGAGGAVPGTGSTLTLNGTVILKAYSKSYAANGSRKPALDLVGIAGDGYFVNAWLTSGAVDENQESGLMVYQENWNGQPDSLVLPAGYACFAYTTGAASEIRNIEARVTGAYRGTVINDADDNRDTIEILSDQKLSVWPVKLADGQLLITKELDRTAAEPESFVFQISSQQPHVSGDRIYYAVVTVSAGSDTGTAGLRNLPPGTYTVTEMESHWQYQIDSLTAAQQQVQLAYDGKTLSAGVQYLNNKDDKNWISGKDSVLNSFDGM